MKVGTLVIDGILGSIAVIAAIILFSTIDAPESQARDSVTATCLIVLLVCVVLMVLAGLYNRHHFNSQ